MSFNIILQTESQDIMFNSSWVDEMLNAVRSGYIVRHRFFPRTLIATRLKYWLCSPGVRLDQKYWITSQCTPREWYHFALCSRTPWELIFRVIWPNRAVKYYFCRVMMEGERTIYKLCAPISGEWFAFLVSREARLGDRVAMMWLILMNTRPIRDTKSQSKDALAFEQLKALYLCWNFKER